MKLYNALGPNPRVVRMFAHEKGIQLELVTVDLLKAENRGAAYTSSVNPAGQVPALQLDEGTVITEITAICEYLEELQPQPSLIGTNAKERAETRMWARRGDLLIAEPMAQGFRYAEGLAIFKDRMRCIPSAAAELKQIGQDGLKWLDTQLGDKPFIVGQRFTFADIALYGLLDFASTVGQPLDPSLTKLGAWFRRVGERPSGAASLHPAATKIHMHG